MIPLCDNMLMYMISYGSFFFPSVQKSTSLPPSGDHVECRRSGPGPRCCRPQPGRLRHTPTTTRLQPGDLYLSAVSVQHDHICECIRVCRSVTSLSARFDVTDERASMTFCEFLPCVAYVSS